MNRNILRAIHFTAVCTATALIAAFWSSTVISELFLPHHAVALLKQSIAYGMILLVISMAATGATGMKMGGKSKHARIAAKRKRMPVIAANGLLILIPCALFLNMRAAAGRFDTIFYTVQAIELLAGAVNFTLMALSMRDGRAIRRPKK
ncbi:MULTISPECIES: hypothetical protein [Neisseria]|uniref:Membrane protein n=1 Tax=Neisseria musculi TaxID=1815583 RepID=A0A7H1MD24_9NEIS|nr:MULTISPECIES: hypothetical protein [Neisseria]MBF0803097.1 hypothetical protein [Neisseria sp. 19428wB4_WF04]QNT59539.1 putative membrane protein [Neisseria musculi]TFU44222.1 hypothetical protein E4T99_01785 [Neisseria sp. WF04]